MGKHIENGPNASALMETARSFGNYDLGSAFADLIDNSIQAEAKAVSLLCLWNSGNPQISIADDGKGMDENELVIAMRLASRSPLEKRALGDLGRFGLGLKTASFSQCRRLTVVSRKSGVTVGARWDLDQVDETFNMELLNDKEAGEIFAKYPSRTKGTVVIWENLDRLTEDGDLSEDGFNSAITDAKQHLALVFHRYLDGEARGTRLNIKLNNVAIEPHDPFDRKNMATQKLPGEILDFHGEKVTVQPYILPYHGKMEPPEYEALSGADGYLSNQGFYIYRNYRLIIYGTWFGLKRKSELTKLARVQIDVPNTLDANWKIPVDKADAQLPARIRTELRRIIDKISGSASRIYIRRGAVAKESSSSPGWVRVAAKGAVHYEVNRKHPLLEAFRLSLDEDERAGFSQVLQLVQNTIPVHAIFADFGDAPRSVAQGGTDTTFLSDLLEYFIKQLGLNAVSASEMHRLVLETEPFSSNRVFVEGLLKKHLPSLETP